MDEVTAGLVAFMADAEQKEHRLRDLTPFLAAAVHGLCEERFPELYMQVFLLLCRRLAGVGYR